MKRVAKGAGTGCLFALTTGLALTAGVVLHLDLPPARRLATGVLNTVLAGSFRGDLTIDGLEGLGLGGVRGVSATLRDDHGTTVLAAKGVTATVATWPALRSALSSKGDLTVTVPELEIASLEGTLAQTPNGDFTLLRAFEPRVPSDPTTPKGRGFALHLPKIALAEAHVHGALASMDPFEADLADVDASFGLTSKTTTVDVRKLGVKTRGLPSHADVDLGIEASLALPAGGDTQVDAKVRGTAGGVPLSIDAAMQGQKVDATVDAPHIDPETVRALVASAPLYEPGALHAEVHGTLPHLVPTATLTVGSGVVDLVGEVTLPDDKDKTTRARATVTAKGLDARAFSKTAPRSVVGFTAHASVLSGDAGMQGDYDLHVPPTSFAGQPIPDVAARGTFKDKTAAGTVHVAEPGAPLELSFALHDGEVVDVDAQTTIKDLSAVKRAGNLGHGKAKLHAKGQLLLATSQVNAHVEAQVDGLDTAGVTLEHATLGGLVQGPLSRPIVSANVAGAGLVAGGMKYGAFAVTVQGPATAPKVSAKLHGIEGPDVEATAKLREGAGTTLDGVEVTLARGDAHLRARVGTVKVGGGGVEVKNATVEGLGQPLTLSLTMRGRSLDARVQGDDLDVHQLAFLVGQDKNVQAGHLAVNAEVHARPSGADGHLVVDLTKGRFPLAGESEVHLDAQLDKHRLTGKITAKSAIGGNVEVTVNDADLEGDALSGATWKKVKGSLQLAADLDLARLAAALPAGTLPARQLEGKLTAHATLARQERSGLPDLDVTAETAGLVVTTVPPEAANADGTVTQTGDAVHSEGLDVNLHATLVGKTSEGALDAELKDPAGVVVRFATKESLPLEGILAGKVSAKTALLETPLDARLEVPSRALDKLPAALGSSPLKGTVDATLAVKGTARAPHVTFDAHGNDLADANAQKPVPINVEAHVTYDGQELETKVVATRPEGRVLDLQAKAQSRSADWIDHPQQALAHWEASAVAVFDKFPIQALGSLAGRQITGGLNGRVELRDLHKAGHLAANLDLTDAKIGRTGLPHASVNLDAVDGALTVAARLEEADGYAEVRARAGMMWGKSVAPQLDPKTAIDASLTAKQFQVGVLSPFVRDTFSTLEGRLNADTKVHAEPGLKNGSVNGAIVLTQGKFESPAFAEEFHDVGARVTMSPWGLVRVDEVKASGLTGQLTASGSAQLEGLTFQSAQGALKITQADRLPLNLQGLSLGEIWGEVDVKARSVDAGKGLDVAVTVPELELDLPQSTGHSVQSLDSDPNIAIGVREKNGKIAILATEAPKKATSSGTPMHIHVTTDLKEIRAKRDTTLKMAVHGTPTVDISDKTVLSGGIVLNEGGFLEVQGKKFVVDNGSVTFTGQVISNPVVSATAYYDSLDKTRVFASFVGPVKTGRLSLRSEPALSQNEIVSLLLFGSSDGSFGQSSPGGGSGENDQAKAAGAAGGVVTEGVNKAISGVTNADISTKVDTSDSTNPRPELEVGITRDISASVAYSLGAPSIGQAPDVTTVTVDWRFIRNWAADLTLGDKGTSIVDLAWRYRY